MNRKLKKKNNCIFYWNNEEDFTMTFWCILNKCIHFYNNVFSIIFLSFWFNYFFNSLLWSSLSHCKYYNSISPHQKMTGICVVHCMEKIGYNYLQSPLLILKSFSICIVHHTATILSFSALRTASVLAPASAFILSLCLFQWVICLSHWRSQDLNR